MFEVRVTADFAAAHFLKDYNGKCENLHGHNYKVYAHVRGNKLNEGGMLLDFAKLKSALRLVCKNLDHTNLNDFDYFEQNPSAERIAKYIYEQIILSNPIFKSIFPVLESISNFENSSTFCFNSSREKLFA